MALAGHVLHALIESGVAEGDGGVAVVEQAVDGFALLESGAGTVLPEDGRGVGERAAQAVVAAAERAVAQLEAVFKNIPEFFDVTARGERAVSYTHLSYHVHVTEPIDAFTKLKFEAQFQHLSPGGAISYVEVPNMQNNLEAVLQVMKFIYDNIIYAELNTKSDYCQVCGWDGEIEIVEDGGKLIWRCPKCGNTDQDKMNVARRTCGYIGTQFWNQGRTQEIKERVLHL